MALRDPKRSVATDRYRAIGSTELGRPSTHTRRAELHSSRTAFSPDTQVRYKRPPKRLSTETLG